MLDDVFAVVIPAVYAEGEMRPGFHRCLPQSSSASRLTDGAAGFLLLIKYRVRPE
jgi:hypothetical protein